MFPILKNSGRVLVLGAHPDDEIGCGGAILRLLALGAKVHHYYFSRCVESLRKLDLPDDTLVSECEGSRAKLGIDPALCGSFDFPVRRFPQYRQEILEELVRLNREIEPDLVFVPNRHDVHQDHHAMCEEAIRAFKYRTVLGYELPWNTLAFHHDCLIAFGEEELSRKLAAVECYKSQLQNHYASIDFFRSLARVRGVQANTTFAECFEVVRLHL